MYQMQTDMSEPSMVTRVDRSLGNMGCTSQFGFHCVGTQPKPPSLMLTITMMSTAPP